MAYSVSHVVRQICAGVPCLVMGLAWLLCSSITARTGNKAQHEVEFWGLLPRSSPRHEKQAARGTILGGTIDHQQRPPKSACLQA